MIYVNNQDLTHTPPSDVHTVNELFRRTVKESPFIIVPVILLLVC